MANLVEGKVGEIGHEPRRPGVVLDGGGDQLGVGIDADDVVPAGEQRRTCATRSAAGIEDPRVPGHHRIDHARLAGEISTIRRHRAEPLDVPLRMAVIGLGEPARRGAHGLDGSG